MWVERRIVQKRCFFFFVAKRHDNQILKVLILLSRNFVVIAEAPILGRGEKAPTPTLSALLRTPGRFTIGPVPVYFTTKMPFPKRFLGP